MANEERISIKPPEIEIRIQVVNLARSSRDIPDVNGYAYTDVDGGVRNALDMIVRDLDESITTLSPDRTAEEMTLDDAHEILSSVHAWAALASRAVGEVYAPASPFPWKAGGWGSEVSARLQALAARFGPAAKIAAKRIWANGVSVSVSFPWGISVGITY